MRYNGQEFERLFLLTTRFLIKQKTKWQKLSLQILMLAEEKITDYEQTIRSKRNARI